MVDEQIAIPAPVSSRGYSNSLHTISKRESSATHATGTLPAQRLANKHGMTEQKLMDAAGYSVYGWGRLIDDQGNMTDLTPSKAEDGKHAEDYLMDEVYNILENAVNPYVYCTLQIWVTSSPCSSSYGTSEKNKGCHEELNEISESYPIVLDVFATKPYQPKGQKGGKKKSVDVMESDSNINYSVDNRTGVALNLQRYVVPPDLAHLGNSVIQLKD